jgi:hypothetical protein
MFFFIVPFLFFSFIEIFLFSQHIFLLPLFHLISFFPFYAFSSSPLQLLLFLSLLLRLLLHIFAICCYTSSASFSTNLPSSSSSSPLFLLLVFSLSFFLPLSQVLPLFLLYFFPFMHSFYSEFRKAKFVRRNSLYLFLPTPPILLPNNNCHCDWLQFTKYSLPRTLQLWTASWNWAHFLANWMYKLISLSDTIKYK